MSCCRTFVQKLAQKCQDHSNPFDCPDIILVQLKSGAVGIPIRDGGESVIKIKHCPFCGAKL